MWRWFDVVVQFSSLQQGWFFVWIVFAFPTSSFCKLACCLFSFRTDGTPPQLSRPDRLAAGAIYLFQKKTACLGYMRGFDLTRKCRSLEGEG